MWSRQPRSWVAPVRSLALWHGLELRGVRSPVRQDARAKVEVEVAPPLPLAGDRLTPPLTPSRLATSGRRRASADVASGAPNARER